MRKTSILSLLLVFIIGFTGAVRAGEIHDACKAGDLAKVKLLLQNDPSLLQSVTPEGKSPLHMATGWGRTDIVSYLLSIGADIKALNNDGGQPIHVAASQNQPACAEILLKNGAEIDTARVNGGFTPLAIAVFKDNYEAAEFLLKNGANPNIKINGRVPLAMVASKRASQRINDLLKIYSSK